MISSNEFVSKVLERIDDLYLLSTNDLSISSLTDALTYAISTLLLNNYDKCGQQPTFEELDYSQCHLIINEFLKKCKNTVITKEECIHYYLNFINNSEILSINKTSYDPTFGDKKICKCGHEYYRHYDHYDQEDKTPHCKYCQCSEFI